MASPPFGSQESGTRLHSYSRKEKSLGVLCTNFLRLYNRDGIESIGLDDAATQLGVERRRIYDVVNILESVGVVARKAKNQYSWKGFAGIPRALEGLEEEGFRENFNNSGCFSVAKDQSKNENVESSAATKVEGHENTSSNNDSRREKSLAQLTENFVKLFLCTDVKLITLDNAATALLGDGQNSSATKVRRLYDITNVLSSINLIEKTHHPESRKQGFRWLGWRGKPKTELLTALLQNESKKRMFGTDITNHCSKRAKLESPINQHSNKAIMNMPTPHTHSKDTSSENVQDGNESEQNPNLSAKSFAYGPFSPVGVRRIGHSGNKNGRQPQDWENLASTFRPQYRNEALCDLFGHYKEAWKSWYTEVAGKEEIHSIP